MQSINTLKKAKGKTTAPNSPSVTADRIPEKRPAEAEDLSAQAKRKKTRITDESETDELMRAIIRVTHYSGQQSPAPFVSSLRAAILAFWPEPHDAATSSKVAALISLRLTDTAKVYFANFPKDAPERSDPNALLDAIEKHFGYLFSSVEATRKLEAMRTQPILDACTAAEELLVNPETADPSAVLIALADCLPASQREAAHCEVNARDILAVRKWVEEVRKHTLNKQRVVQLQQQYVRPPVNAQSAQDSVRQQRRRCGICGLSNHPTNRCRKPRGNAASFNSNDRSNDRFVSSHSSTPFNGGQNNSFVSRNNSRPIGGGLIPANRSVNAFPARLSPPSPFQAAQALQHDLNQVYAKHGYIPDGHSNPNGAPNFEVMTVGMGGHDFLFPVALSALVNDVHRVSEGKALLDTGAQATIIDRKLADTLQPARIKLAAPIQLHGIGGPAEHITERCDTIDICLGDVTFAIRPFVATSPRHMLILGSDFITANRLNILNTSDGPAIQQASDNRIIHVATANVEDPADTLRRLFPEFQVLADPEDPLFHGPADVPAARIKLKTGAVLPPPARIRPQTAADQEEIAKAVEDLLAKQLIYRCMPVTASPVIVSRQNGKVRVVIDSRRINDVTETEAYPMPIATELLQFATGHQYITCIDAKAAFHRVALDEDSQRLSTFLCRQGAFAFRVLSFGLKNASAFFQRAIDTVLHGAESYARAYIDDVVVVSDTFDQHVQHVRDVLSRFHRARLPLSIGKCQFFQSEVTFLGHRVSKQGIVPLVERTTAIVNWPRPTNVKALQRFLGVASYYRDFIRGHAELTAPLTDMLKNVTSGTKPLEWTDEAHAAFTAVKNAFIAPPMLRALNFDKPLFLECDASGRAIGAALLQDFDGIRLPVAYFSRKLHNAELNYLAYDLELLAIVAALKHFRHTILSSPHQLTIFSDHKSLSYFSSLRELSARHVRIHGMLADFNFVICYRKGSDQLISDALSRADVADAPDRRLVLLPEELFARPMDIEPAAAEAQQALPGSVPIDLIASIRAATANDSSCAELAAKEGFSLKDGLLFRTTLAGDLIVVPEASRVAVLEAMHDHAASGHMGVDKTMQLILRNFWFPSLRATVAHFIASCRTCAQDKHSRLKQAGLLHPLPRPRGPWQDVHVDFFGPIVEAPGGEKYVVVFIDRYTRMAHFAALTDIKTETLVRAFIQCVYRAHGPPSNITSDRGRQFISDLWNALASAAGIDISLTSAYWPQANGLCERVNQHLIAYLRHYINAEQNDWVTLLPFCELAYNNSPHSSIGISPFHLTYGYDADPHLLHVTGLSSSALDPTGLLASIEQAQTTADAFNQQRIESMTRQANRHRREAPIFKPGDLVLVDRHSINIDTDRPSDKLDHLTVGPFRVLERVSDLDYRIDLPDIFQGHNVIHVSKLRPVVENQLPGRTPFVQRSAILDDEYDVESILDHRQMEDRTLEFLVQFVGDPKPRWQPVSNLDGCLDLVDHYWRKRNLSRKSTSSSRPGATATRATARN